MFTCGIRAGNPELGLPIRAQDKLLLAPVLAKPRVW